MKTLVPMATLFFLAGLVAPGDSAAVERAVLECRVQAGLAGDTHAPTYGEARAMYDCVHAHIIKIDIMVGALKDDFRAWRNEHEQRLVDGGGQLAARSCQEEKDNRRYIENRIGDVRTVREKQEQHAERYETLYRDYIFEINVLLLGTPGGGDTLAQLIREVNNDLLKRSDDLDRELKALQRFYVDLQQTRFQDACGSPPVAVRPPAQNSDRCKWQLRTAYNAVRGLNRPNTTGYVCTCPPADGRSVWPAADSQRCGPYPSERAGGAPSAPPPSRPAQPPAASSGGWQPVQ